jgi:predicted  nucleic acid-binding Zn-ribbon protein
MSTPVPQLLKELHRLRRHLRELQSEIDLGPRVQKARQTKLAAEEQTHKDAYDTIKKLKLKQKEDEGTLKQTEQRISKLEFDLNVAGSKKEFDAKQSEIAQATAKKGELEDAILTAITEIEERTAKLPDVEKQWAEAQKEFATAQAEAKERLERMLADQKETQAKLAETEAKLPANVKPLYERLVKAYGADGLAGLKSRSCQQCRMTVTEMVVTKINAGDYVTCPTCGRGLYVAD